MKHANSEKKWNDVQNRFSGQRCVELLDKLVVEVVEVLDEVVVVVVVEVEVLDEVVVETELLNDVVADIVGVSVVFVIGFVFVVNKKFVISELDGADDTVDGPVLVEVQRVFEDRVEPVEVEEVGVIFVVASKVVVVRKDVGFEVGIVVESLILVPGKDGLAEISIEVRLREVEGRAVIVVITVAVLDIVALIVG